LPVIPFTASETRPRHTVPYERDDLTRLDSALAHRQGGDPAHRLPKAQERHVGEAEPVALLHCLLPRLPRRVKAYVNHLMGGPTDDDRGASLELLGSMRSGQQVLG